jgi:predicted transcriptional regulator
VSKRLQQGLSKRERQIMESVYRRKSASVAEVLAAISDPPSYSAVRATLNILERKGFLTHRKEGRKYLFIPTIPHQKARQSAIKQLLHIYFDNSIEAAVAALIRVDRKGLTESDCRKLIAMIETVGKEDRL